jgi:SIR2-like domain
MATKFLHSFPKPLLDDLVAALRENPAPTTGSHRPAMPEGKTIPLWGDLGDLLGHELGDYVPSNALDAISAYEHEFGRPKLIERLSDLLLVDEVRPAVTHRAFCSIPFDLVCTTNFDFLLERQYELIPRHCTPLVDEDQLAVNLKQAGVALLKLHGDLHHPTRMVATETDYDRFLDRFPLLATFLANLLITRTAVLVGYSLDDPDFRQVWQIVGERLGRSRRIAYAIAVGFKSTDITRFERRGIHVINLPGSRNRYAEILADAFTELRDFWRDKVIPSSQVKEEQPLRELSLPPEVPTRLCFFAVPLTLLSFYRERVFPVVRNHGFVPVSADDVVSPGDAILPKIEVLIQRALLFVVDASTQNTLVELRLALRTTLEPSRILVIVRSKANLPIDLPDLRVLVRPDVSSADPDDFLSQVEEWFAAAAERYRPTLLEEPSRLLEAREYRAAIIAAISLLETTLRQRLDVPKTLLGKRSTTLTMLLDDAQVQGLLGDVPSRKILEWLRIRNQVVHSDLTVHKATAEEIVKGVLQIVQGGLIMNE